MRIAPAPRMIRFLPKDFELRFAGMGDAPNMSSIRNGPPMDANEDKTYHPQGRALRSPGR
jgi:hypothetical protein